MLGIKLIRVSRRDPRLTVIKSSRAYKFAAWEGTKCHNDDVTSVALRLKSPTTQLFIQQPAQICSKQNGNNGSVALSLS